MKPHLSLFSAALIGLAGAATPQIAIAAGIAIAAPYTFATSTNAKSGGGYMTITNTGDTEDRLTAAATPIANTMIHRTEVDDAGVARMKHQMNGVVIPAGETVIFEPGGLHVMMMGLQDPLVEGATVPLTLTFESAGEISVDLSVIARGTQPDS